MNDHYRDGYIEFFEHGHRYIIRLPKNFNEEYDEVSYKSVTTWIHEQFPPFDADAIIEKMQNGRNYKEGHAYWGMTAREIKAKWKADAQLGTDLHYQIECFLNENHRKKREEADVATNPPICHQDLLEIYLKEQQQVAAAPQAPEWGYFLNFVADHPTLVPYRSEWMVFHEDLQIAGSIDMVYINPEEGGTLQIYDWKRSKEITALNPFRKFALPESAIPEMADTNFWHYALQLNIYKRILEDKYDKRVTELYLIRLHPNGENYERIPVPDLQEEVTKMMEERKKKIV
jgi:ATP-dependent exoDNAse (exonuclease V) beta subunit